MKFLMQGETIEATRVEVVNSTEGQNVYLLANGAVARVKTMLVGLYALEGKRDGLGRPVYHVETHVIVTVDEGEQKA